MNKFKKESWQAKVMQFIGFICLVIGIAGNVMLITYERTTDFRSFVFFIPLISWIIIVYLACDEECYEFTEEDYWRGQ